jgi:CubicO group peptidase (beta-lactamase class C family)
MRGGEGVERTTPATAEDLELMRGTPPPDGRRVTLQNWLLAPFNRWSLQHLREIVPTAPIRGADAPASLPRAERDVEAIRLDLGDRTWTVGELLDATYTDGFLVLQGGAVVVERYANGMAPGTAHVMFSTTKSVVATVAGALMARGLLRADAEVGEVLPELAGTSWADATVQHLLDMRTGTRFDEVYEDAQGDMGVYAAASGMAPSYDPGGPDTYGYLSGLENDREHGGRFDYRSVVTSMLGWVVERAGGERLPELISREVWRPIGAENEACIALDRNGNAMAAGGMSATLRDLARFGLLWLRRGTAPDGSRVVDDAWVADTIAGAHDGREAYGASLDAPDPDFPDTHYRNKWWVVDPATPFYSGIGIHGQFVAVHEAADVVIAKFSSLPQADDLELDGLQLVAFRALAEALAG